VRICVLTTSYPRDADDVAGAFVRDAVEHVRARGVTVDVVSPASFAHFGIAYGGGIVQNLRARPWLAAALPAFGVAFRRAAARAARDADVVHAHWLPAGAVAATLGKPYVVQVWGTDVELARRAPWLVRPVLQRAKLVIAASTELEREARALGAARTRVVVTGVDTPEEVPEPDDPPHVLFVGRLSPEKGILEFVNATSGLPRVVVGDGPLRSRVPEARGFVPPRELSAYYARAAVVCVPSRREGYGVVAREAMAHGRPVVASAVGGLLDAVEHEKTGLLVPPRDAGALRSSVERLLADADLRRRLGEAGRARAREHLSWRPATDGLLEAYAAAAS
jgi:phosphatidylinositol alpha 1,6-mannosyltransferase